MQRRRNSSGRLIPIRPEDEKITLTMQGKLLTLQRQAIMEHEPSRGKRSEITTFSPKSRKRILQFINTIAWGKIPTSLFLTLTYPDQVDWTTSDERNKHRYLFMRYMENYLGRTVPGIWRVEWLPRQSGDCEGMIAPHFHLLLFGVSYIHYMTVRHWWKKAIGWDKTVSTVVKKCGTAKKAGIYISKYIGKRPKNPYLDIGPYLNTGGRHWGFLRKDEVPLSVSQVIEEVTPDELEWLLARANVILKWRNWDDDNGFAIMGDMSNYLYSEFLQFRLDNRIE